MEKRITIAASIIVAFLFVAVFAAIIFCIVSFFTVLWPYGCVLLFLILWGILSYVVYDITNDEEDQDQTPDL